MARSWRERKKYYREKNMTEAFESYEFLLFEKLEQVDHLICLIQKEAATFGVPEETRVSFMRDKLIDMIEQISEKRGV